MKTILTSTLIFLVSLLHGQNDKRTRPWDIGCDSMRTQTEMNICSYESFKIADSILNSKYKRLTKYIDSCYASEKKSLSKIPEKFELEFLETLANQKTSVQATQRDFIKFRDSMTDIIGFEYRGGTMRPLAVNQYALELTVKHMETLDKMTEEIMR